VTSVINVKTVKICLKFARSTVFLLISKQDVFLSFSSFITVIWTIVSKLQIV